MVVATAPRRRMRASCSGVAALRWTRTQRRSRIGWRRARSSHTSSTSGRQRVTSVFTRSPWRAASSACCAVGVGVVGALHEPGPARVGLGRVQDARDLGVAAVVQADAAHAQPVVAEPAPAGPGRQRRDGVVGVGRLPGRAHGERAAQRQLAARVALAVGAEHLGGHAVSLVDRGDAAGGVAALRLAERPQAIGRREPRRRPHQRELEHLDQVVLDEEAGRLAGGVLDDLDAPRRRGRAGDAGRRQRHGCWRPSGPAAGSSSPRCRGCTRDGRARRRRDRRGVGQRFSARPSGRPW